jgi:hypothetical protein
MRRRHRTLRELLAEIRRSPDDEAADARAGQCAEALFDQERCACHDLGEREEAALEAERRRWDHVQPANTNVTTSSTGL